MIQKKRLGAWGITKVLLGLLLFLPGAGSLLWIISSADGRRTIHQIWQRAAHLQFDDQVLTYSLLMGLAIIGYLLIRSAFK
jgi:hypothetical protein